ncbi:GTP 3',8-cyclase MoaA [Fusobacterium sp.]|uniref:GTP 3',8-cyclase MoaA n=1 Tax=Fusobacterium sp. TaxID=68766 RepID=UPI000C6FF7AD|nr:GTP 3',8-cyclase MoaA [Fusobacterium sp.]
MKDKNNRKIEYLRLSITDRCNLRCYYCMGENDIEFLPKNEILTPDEIKEIVEVFADLGVTKIRITGGEPLVRKNFQEIVEKIASVPNITDINLTTNGIELEKYLPFLKNIGINSINISLDTLKNDLYKKITGCGDLQKVLNAIKTALELKINKIKLNIVIIKGQNDSEIMDFVELSEKFPIDIRFIELMPIGAGKDYKGVSNEELIEYISKHKKLIKINERLGSGPAIYYHVENAKGNIGFINPISHNFCEFCNRVRITPEGFLKLCLHSKDGINLKDIIRNKKNKYDLKDTITNAIYFKPLKHKMDKDDDGTFDTRFMNRIGG